LGCTVPGIEKLTAASNSGPALPGEHGEISHGCEAADIGGAVVVSAHSTHIMNQDQQLRPFELCSAAAVSHIAIHRLSVVAGAESIRTPPAL